jgi:HAD superfamily hydrolase (TIGR01509 family)
MTIRAALFDMDGTIYESGIDWLALREEIDIPWDGRPILAQLAEADEETRARGTAALHRAEAEGAANGNLIAGTIELLNYLHKRGVRCALVTNNSRRSASTVLDRHELPFDIVLTREDGPSKPAPDLFLAALDRLGVDPGCALVIGDAHLDVLAAHAAGVPEVILVGSPAWMKEHIPEDVHYQEAENLHQVLRLVEGLIEAMTG